MSDESRKELTKLTAKIIECIINVHRRLGPGFFESVYKNAMVIELRKQGLHIDVEKEFAIKYDGQEIGRHRLDIVVEGKVVLELKSVERISKVHYAQVRSYLRVTGCELGLLVNFNDFKADFRRVRL